MIIKSMSRKEPSFSQLTQYMSDEKSDRDFYLYHNLYARGPENITQEFERNAKLLSKRKNGNYLFHEILSIDTRQIGQGRDVKEALMQLVYQYVEKRCNRSLVFGALHEDHADHLHYHLMISANEADSRKRQRLSRAEFDAAKKSVEKFALEQFPELKQELLIGAPMEKKIERRKERQNRKAQEIEKRGGKLTKREALAEGIRLLMKQSHSQEEFEALLLEQGFTFYTRGKHMGIKKLNVGETAVGKKKTQSFRFATLKIAQDYADFAERCGIVIELDTSGGRSAGEKEKGAATEVDEKNMQHQQPDNQGQEQRTQKGDNEDHVKYDSNTDSKQETPSRQESGVRQDESNERIHATQEKKPLEQEPEKSEFMRDMDEVYAKKRERAARKQTKKLERKPRSR